jgi:hemerythrin-like metal-binding protein
MAALDWNTNLSVGISSFDNQHKKLIELYNNFYDSVVKKESKEKMSLVIKGLKDYTVYHFTDEEKWMKLYHFPDFESHKEDHDKFVNAVLDLEKRYSNGRMILSIEIINFIRDWITKHIVTIDKQYTEFLTKHGVH